MTRRKFLFPRFPRYTVGSRFMHNVYTAENCTFCDTSAIFSIRFDFNMRVNIRYGATSENDVVS